MSLPNDLSQYLVESYDQVHVWEADIIYIYTDFRNLGALLGRFPNREAFCSAFIDPLLKRGKTVVTATFTYTSEGRFDVQSTPTNLGAINKWFLKHPEHQRSEHPLFSYAALGPQASLVKKVGKSAFGYNSVFERLYGKKTAFLHVGRPIAMGNTAIHHIEHKCGATYRINKAFKTEVYEGENYIGTDYTAILRRRDVPGESFEFNFEKAAQKLYDAKLIREVGSTADLTNVSFYWYDETLELMSELFYKDQRIFISSDFMQY